MRTEGMAMARDGFVGRLAITLGVVWLASIVSLAVFYAVALNRALGSDAGWPRRLPTLGVVAGAIMVLGLVAAPGIAMGLDDMSTAPGWVWVGFLGWIGTYLVYPLWSIWLGRRLLSA